MGRDIRLPQAKFSCASCGRCCTMWSVTVDAQKVAKLREHDWSHIGSGDPFVKNRGPGEDYRLRMIDGRCFFLAEDKRCRIHSEINYDAKPEGCKAFPLHFVEVAGQSHARLSFYCPTVTANQGKSLRDQMRWVRKTHKAAGDIKRDDKLTLDYETELSAREVDRIEDLLAQRLEQKEEVVGDRIAACGGILRELVAAAEAGKAGLGKKIDHLRSQSTKQLAEIGRANGSASRAGPVLSLFLGSDCKPGKASRLTHFFGVRGFNLGLSKLNSFMMKAKASRGQIKRTKLTCDEESNALLTRYLLHKLRSRRYLAGEMSVVGGFNLLVAAFGVIDRLARLSAAAAGRQETDSHDIASAVQAADLLVVEHTTIYNKAMFSQLIERILAPVEVTANMLARIEG